MEIGVKLAASGAEREKLFCLVTVTLRRKPEIAMLGRGLCLEMAGPPPPPLPRAGLSVAFLWNSKGLI